MSHRNFLIRFSTRHTLSLTIAFLIGLWDNNPALHAAIWLLMLGGPPSHGATARKFTMRAIGASGALALAALGTILVDPNFTSPGPYMGVIFVGTWLMAYIGEGGGILSYLAIGGTAFVIGYGGPGPRADVLGSIWSIWGISLGMIIRAAVSLLWPEKASRTLAEQFQEPLAAMLELLEEDEGSQGQRRRAAAEKATVAGIAMMLTVANDAMLEGPSSEIDGNQLVSCARYIASSFFRDRQPDVPRNAWNRAGRLLEKCNQGPPAVVAAEPPRSNRCRRDKPRATQGNGQGSEGAGVASIVGRRR